MELDFFIRRRLEDGAPATFDFWMATAADIKQAMNNRSLDEAHDIAAALTTLQHIGIDDDLPAARERATNLLYDAEIVETDAADEADRANLIAGFEQERLAHKRLALIAALELVP